MDRRFTDEIDVLMDILGNSTRRSILRLLSVEPHYPYQISRILGVSQRAVVKQLELLTQAGIIHKMEDRQHAPSRGKSRGYFQLGKTLRLSVGISPHGFRIVIPKGAVVGNVDKVFQEMVDDLETIVRREDKLATINSASNAISEISDRISLLESEIAYLLDRKRELSSRIDTEIQELIPEYGIRQIVRDIAIRAEGITIGELSEIHDVRIKAIFDLLTPLVERDVLVMRGSEDQPSSIHLEFRPPIPSKR